MQKDLNSKLTNFIYVMKNVVRLSKKTLPDPETNLITVSRFKQQKRTAASYLEPGLGTKKLKKMNTSTPYRTSQFDHDLDDSPINPLTPPVCW